MAHANRDIREERLRALLKDMIDIYSPSGKEDDIADFLCAYLGGMGFDVESQAVEKTRRNVIVAGDENAPLLLLGHIDTVSAPDFDHYGFEEEEGMVYGLGAADMKGGCAAMIEALCAFRERGGAALPATLALVVGEEETGDGVEAFLEDYHCPWAIVAEPTGLRPCFSHYGYLEFLLNASGKRVHASQASGEDNAVFSMLSTLLRIAAHCREERSDVIFNIRDLTSAHAGFAVPDRCEAWIDLHVPPLFPMEELIFEIEDIARGFSRSGANSRIEIACNTVHHGYSLPEKGLLADVLKGVFGTRGMEWESGAFVSDSDAVHLWQKGVRPVVLGPGGLEMAHTYGERVLFAQIADAARIYLEVLARLAAAPGGAE